MSQLQDWHPGAADRVFRNQMAMVVASVRTRTGWGGQLSRYPATTLVIVPGPRSSSGGDECIR